MGKYHTTSKYVQNSFAMACLFGVTMALPNVALANTASQLKSQLLGWWAFDESKNQAVIQDKSHYKHNGSTTASRSGDAVCGRSLQFQGHKNGGYATIASANHLNFHQGSQSFSVSLWIKLNNYEHVGQPITAIKKGTSAGYDNTVTLSLSPWASGVQFSTATEVSWNENASIYRPINDNTWHHLAYAKSAGSTTLYIDGQQVSKPLVGALPPFAGRSPFTVGRPEPGSSAISFPGLIDELTVFSGTLSRDQVSWLRQNPCSLDSNGNTGNNNAALQRKFHGTGLNQSANRTFNVAITHQEVAAEQKIEFVTFSPNNTPAEAQCLPQRLKGTLVNGRASMVTALPDTLPSCTANEGTVISVTTTISADKKSLKGNYFTSNGGFGSFNASLTSSSSLSPSQIHSFNATQ